MKSNGNLHLFKKLSDLTPQFITFLFSLIPIILFFLIYFSSLYDPFPLSFILGNWTPLVWVFSFFCHSSPISQSSLLCNFRLLSYLFFPVICPTYIFYYFCPVLKWFQVTSKPQIFLCITSLLFHLVSTNIFLPIYSSFEISSFIPTLTP